MGNHAGRLREVLGDSSAFASEIAPLCRLQMNEIRRMYDMFVRMKLSPGVTMSELATILASRASERESRLIFRLFVTAQNVRVSLYEIFSFALLNSSSFGPTKHFALFELHDVERRGWLSGTEVVVMVGSTLRALCRATKRSLPTVEVIEHLVEEAGFPRAAITDSTLPAHQWMNACRTDPGIRFVLRTFGMRCSLLPAQQGQLEQAEQPAVDLGSRDADTKCKPKHGHTSLMSKHPSLVKELKKELRILRGVFDHIDVDHSGQIALSEFVEASAVTCKATVGSQQWSSSFEKHVDEIFRKSDVNNDGMISWEELVSSMFGKYGKAAVRDMLFWDLTSSVADDDTSSVVGALSSAVVSRSQIADIKHTFAIYAANTSRQGDAPPERIAVEDLATAMARVHDLDETDLLLVLNNAGWPNGVLVDQDDFVDIFKDLVADDQAFIHVLKRTGDDHKQGNTTYPVRARRRMSYRVCVAPAVRSLLERHDTETTSTQGNTVPPDHSNLLASVARPILKIP